PRDAAFDGRVGKRLRLGEKPDAEVIRDVRDRAYPVGAQSVVEQCLLSLTPGKGWQPVGISPDPARVAVRPLEVLPGRHGDAPGEEQVLEGPLRSAPSPPGAAFTVRGRLQMGQVGRSQRSSLADRMLDRGEQLRLVDLRVLREELGPPRLVLLEAMLESR